MKSSPHVAHLLTLLWGWFLFWMGCAWLVFPLYIGEVTLQGWFGEGGLTRALALVLNYFDLILYLLAALNLHIYASRHDGLNAARRWLTAGAVGTAVLLYVAVRTGVPLGTFVFTTRLGPRFDNLLPLGAPLLWYTFLIGSAYTARALVGRERRAATLLTGLLMLLAVLNLDPLASKVRYYWFWDPRSPFQPAGPTAQYFLTWVAVALLFGWLFHRTPARPGVVERRWSRPVLVFVLFNALFLLVHLVQMRLR